jgi:hypothetical protein
VTRNYVGPMATIKTVEREIFRVEGIEVRILHGRDGRDVRSDKTGVPGYRYKRGFPGHRSVSVWTTTRFTPSYPASPSSAYSDPSSDATRRGRSAG